MRTGALAGCALLMLISVGWAAAADPEPLAVGKEAPAFTLQDQDGAQRSLDEFLKKGKVALVFYRSADW